MTRSGPIRIAALLAVMVCFSLPRSVQADALADQQATARRFLHGAIDLHFHVDPPTQISPGGNIDEIRSARQAGLRALLLKSHGESTAPLAYHLGLDMPDMTLIGGIVLNRTIGGINLAAVQRLASLKGRPGRVVWMPTEDSEAQAKLSAQLSGKPMRATVPVSKGGQLLPEVKEVIAFIGQSDLVLATGHLGAEDALRVLREGQVQGLKHMIATHPMDFGGKMTLEQMKQAVQTGAVAEFDFRTLVEAGGAEVIRTLGPEHCFISEFWTYTLPGPPAPEPFKPMEYAGLEGVGRFVNAMHQHGFSDAELDLMVKTNPAKLLGLPSP